MIDFRRPEKVRSQPVAVSCDRGTMKFGEVRRRLRSEGFEIVAQNGSHEQWKKPGRSGRVTVAGKTSVTVGQKTLKSIAGRAGWSNE